MKLQLPALGKLGHWLLFGGVGALMAFNATLIFRTQRTVTAEQKQMEEAAKPAELEIVVLTAPQCTECFDINALTAPLKNNPKVVIKQEQTLEYTSDEGVAMVKKYQLTRVPTLLVRGDTEKAFDTASFLQNLGIKAEDGTLVVTNVPPPYIEIASGALKGKFTVTYLTDQGCKECYDPRAHQQALAQLAMKPAAETFVDRTEAHGKALIAQYQIKTVPTIIIQGELKEYPRFEQIWSSVGTVEKDGAYVFRAGQAFMGAYKDLRTGQVIKPSPPPEVPGEAQTPTSPDKPPEER